MSVPAVPTGWILVHLDALLKQRGMTATELADRIGITQANVSILKTGKAKAIRFTTLVAICDVLDCQPGDVLSFERLETDGAAEEAGGAARAESRNIVLVDAGPRPIAVIKAIREVADLGLREAKELVDSVPAVVLSGLGREDAETTMERLNALGATAEVR